MIISVKIGIYVILLPVLGITEPEIGYSLRFKNRFRVQEQRIIDVSRQKAAAMNDP